jgi:hypothetical protein
VPRSTTGQPIEGLTHLYAVLRILFGALGCLFLLGLGDLSMFWDPSGLVPGPSGWKQVLIDGGWGALFGRSLFFIGLGSYLMMTVGYRTTWVVPLSFVVSSVQASWNPLPLSAAFEVCRAIVFCLMWADCGQVWSIDNWLARRPVQPSVAAVSPWPLYLIRFQVAVVYAVTGVWKLGGEQWRDGSALHYVLNNNGFARFPFGPPPAADWLLTLSTYGVLLWELAFPLLVAFRRTRAATLWVGVALHLGMWITMELGPFAWVMIASYASFLEPGRVPTLAARFRRRPPQPSIGSTEVIY